MHTLFSTSKYLVGLRCEKRLWLKGNRRDLLPTVPPTRQQVIDQGRAVRQVTRELFPGAILFDENPLRLAEAIAGTRAALEAGATTIFEPCFSFEDTTALMSC